MKKAVLVLSPLCLGFVCGIAIVVACNSSSNASAQTASGHTVVDSTGAVLGSLIGIGPGFASTYNANGTATPVLVYPHTEAHTFLDSSNRIWSLSGNGDFLQPVAAVFFTAASCAGTPYIEQGDPKAVLKHAGSYWTRPLSAAAIITPLSSFPAGSPASTCEPYPPSGSSAPTTISAFTAASLVPQTPPTFTPPITIN